KAIARRTEESDRRGRSGSTSGDHEDRGRSASKQVTLTSDGSWLFNPRPGSGACLLRFGAAEPVLSGSEPGHNKERGVNRYVSRCVSAGWLNSRGERIANRCLWEETDPRKKATSRRMDLGSWSCSESRPKTVATGLHRRRPVAQSQR